MAQLSEMSHWAPIATSEPVRFKFAPKTVVGNVVVVEQVCWEAVPDTWPGNSKASVTERVVCAWNREHDQSLDSCTLKQKLKNTS